MALGVIVRSCAAGFNLVWDCLVVRGNLGYFAVLTAIVWYCVVLLGILR